jgi:hypothetical protein
MVGKRATRPDGLRARCPWATRVPESTDSPDALSSRFGVTRSTHRVRCEDPAAVPPYHRGYALYRIGYSLPVSPACAVDRAVASCVA